MTHLVKGGKHQRAKMILRRSKMTLELILLGMWLVQMMLANTTYTPQKWESRVIRLSNSILTIINSTHHGFDSIVTPRVDIAPVWSHHYSHHISTQIDTKFLRDHQYNNFVILFLLTITLFLVKNKNQLLKSFNEFFSWNSKKESLYSTIHRSMVHSLNVSLCEVNIIRCLRVKMCCHHSHQSIAR